MRHGRLTPRKHALVWRVKVDYDRKVSTKQLERWAYDWHAIQPLGGPRGTRTHWRPGLDAEIPDVEVGQAAEVARLVTDGASRDEVLVTLAASGWPVVDPEAVRAATRRLAERVVGRLRIPGSAYGMAARSQKGLRRQVRKRLEAFEDGRKISLVHPVSKKESAEPYFETLADGIRGNGPAAHLASGLDRLEGLTAEQLVEGLRLARSLAAPQPSPREFLRAEGEQVDFDEVVEAYAAKDVPAPAIVAQLLDLLTQPGSFAASLRARLGVAATSS